MRGVGYLLVSIVCGVTAWQIGEESLLWVAGLLVGVVLMGVLTMVGGRPALQVVREVSESQLMPGSTMQVSIVLSNSGLFPQSNMMWRDQIPPKWVGGNAGLTGVVGGRRGRNSHKTMRYDLRVGGRGRFNVGPLWIQQSDPLRVVVRRRIVGDSIPVVVLPQVWDLRAGLNVDQFGALADFRMRSSHGGTEDEVIPRPYRSGDSYSRLHWKATAHRGELMVRHEEQHHNQRALVHLDTSVAAFAGATENSEDPTFEWCVSVTASIVAELLRDGFDIDLVWSQTHREIRNDESFRKALIELAEVRPSSSEQHEFASARTVYLVLGVLTSEVLDEVVERFARINTVHVVVSAQSPAALTEQLSDLGWNWVSYTADDPLPLVWSRLLAVKTQ